MDWIDNYLEKISVKVAAECERMPEGIPYLAKDGHYNDMAAIDISWWTNGFFPGILWQLHAFTGKELFMDHAERVEAQLDCALEEFIDLHHDVGFMWLHSAVANYRQTASPDSKIRGLKAAAILASRFNLKGQFLRAWNKEHTGWIIIDSMMNIPLLYWASQETRDPRFEQIAMAHADTVQSKLIRKDGSSGHIASFDAETGAFIELIGGQGYDAQSAWSRGQAWALYGFALSYKHTKNQSYLETAVLIANSFIANTSETNHIPRIDFRAPATTNDTDTSAGLIACCGLLEIAAHVPETQQAIYKESAVKIVTAILENYCDFDASTDGIVKGSTVAYHDLEGRNVSLVYGDYYLVECLLKLKGEALDLW
ncbi:glycoside hydrolase family 88 protein [Enterococcus hulanensis]|uniref:glycoside hydrolase family 88 protein n=1 Tax=Enterococcus hulanensis TaxID=2559929 RepID=UPI00288F2A0A|nr:glycoside hydrolase family 88 protein [Enterococcus hulanensis]MDT2660528.1 glycoside hydrolase family 88 protein [Enterococcus hulanensis]